MIDLSNVKHHAAIDDISEILAKKTRNSDRGFYRPAAAFFLCKMASCMRATIISEAYGSLPVSCYTLALATSGYGKGRGVNIVEREFMRGFSRRFTEDTLPMLADDNLWKLARERAIRQNTDEQEEYDRLLKSYNSTGPYLFTFDKATEPAVKQLRYKLLLAGSGSINLQIDEIGSNLAGSDELLTLFLELFDQGLVKPKLIKHTSDNPRSDDMDGKTPTNFLMFGTPTSLFDGGAVEEKFRAMLSTGYARRCLYGFGTKVRDGKKRPPAEEVYKSQIDPQHKALIGKWAQHFHSLADPARYSWKLEVSDAVGIRLVEYQGWCEDRADEMKINRDIQKSEMEHRYFKALKIAGAYAFVDGSNEIEMDHLMSAILLVEESGVAFERILSRDMNHVRLAKYLAEVGEPVSTAVLLEELPFYPKAQGPQAAMMTHAMSWGYGNNIIIKKTFVDGLEFFKGETLKQTNLEKIRVSYSDNWAFHYEGEEAPFNALHQLVQAPGMNWCNHHFKDKHRTKENAIPGFNMLVFDVDGGIKLETVHELLKDHVFMTYTTKRHTPENHRFRVLMPINYVLELTDDDYKIMYDQVLGWLPFAATNPDADIDQSANQRSKKYLSHEGGTYHYNLDGTVFDILRFIPKTRRNDEYKKDFKKLANLGNLERWFAERMADGNRNNHMIRFALALVDNGHDLADIRQMVLSFNEKLDNKLDVAELDSSVMVTVAKRIQKNLARMVP
jgi:hypothetical protein